MVCPFVVARWLLGAGEQPESGRDMAGERKRIGLRDVRALGPGEIVWDSAVAGFGARRQKGPAVSYFVKYRTADGRQRWQVIGRHGVLTPDEARGKAKAILGDVVDGADPAADKMAARRAMTVTELCDLYFADAEAGRLLTRRRGMKKASTLLTDRGRIERHIKPLLGRMAVAAIDHSDVERFMHGVAEGKTAGRIKTGRFGLARVNGGKGTATRTVGLLGAIFTYAVRQGVRADNPVHGVVRYADGRRERRLSDDEYAALGDALRQAEAAGKIWPAAVAMARFLALTGWRSGEAQALRWAELDLARRTATLSDTKTGRSVRPLSHAACDVLHSLPRLAGDRTFPATRGDGPMVGFKKFWPKIAKLGALPADITPHVLRHSFASLAADLGYSEPTIATLVGHQGHSITSRYMHVADAPLLVAADAVANRTTELMGEMRSSGAVVELRRAAL
jgi:integrase